MDWIEKYLSYTAQHESPEIMHKWSAITGIAATLNRNVWFPRASNDGRTRYKSYPGQLMTVIVAGAGKLRKSTTAHMIEHLLREAGTVSIYTGKITPEQLLAKLGNMSEKTHRSVMTIISDELSYFFSTQKYNENMVPTILKLSEAKDRDEYETRGNQFALENICLTMMLCTTPESLGDSVHERVHGEGLTSRYVWIYADKPKLIEALMSEPSAVLTEAAKINEQLEKDLIAGLMQMAKLAGPFTATPEARSWYQDWYHTHMKEMNGDGDGWSSRMHEHLVRVSMPICVAETMAQRIERRHFEEVHKMLVESVKDHPKAFAFIGRHDSANQKKIILKLFTLPDSELTTAEIFRKAFSFFKDQKELTGALEMLTEAGFIYVKSMNASSGKADATWALVRGDFKRK